MQPKRNYKDKKYKEWRLAVYRRDKFACRVCGSRKRIQAHHIKRWADYPELRFVVSNGITLCKKCHQKVWNEEEDFEFVFKRIISKESYLSIKLAIRNESK